MTLVECIFGHWIPINVAVHKSTGPGGMADTLCPGCVERWKRMK